MNKYNIIASQVEADTTASFPLLLEDETFKNLLNTMHDCPPPQGHSEGLLRLGIYI